MDKDYVILKNQEVSLSDIKVESNSVKQEFQAVDELAQEAQARLSALYKAEGLSVPEFTPNLKVVPSFSEKENSEVLADYDYDTIFKNAFNDLEAKGINPNTLTRADFLDSVTLRRIDADVNIPLYKQPHLDKYDYIISACCGVISGLVDSFFVGKPEIKATDKGLLQKFTDDKVDKIVNAFAQCVQKSDKKAYEKALAAANKLTDSEAKKAAIAVLKKPSKISEGNIGSAIGYLENRFKINYDARYASDLIDGEGLNMRPSTHHIVSLGHSPDIVGLFFSVLDQFTEVNSFISQGKVVRLDPVKTDPGFKLVGGTFISKIYCGICNWLGHIMSDIAGSSGTRGHLNGGRGSGVPIPFFELFQLCDFGSFKNGNDTMNVAQIMVAAFEKGYDLRFAATMAIPVILNEVLIRLLWSLKSHFYHQRTWKESIPVGDHPELQRMLLIGQGCLCIVDMGDAAIRSGGNAVEFMLHLNIVGWIRVSFEGYKQIKKAYDQDGLLDTKAINKSITDEWKAIYQDIVENHS